jgi:hypothetical protein
VGKFSHLQVGDVVSVNGRKAVYGAKVIRVTPSGQIVVRREDSGFDLRFDQFGQQIGGNQFGVKAHLLVKV